MTISMEIVTVSPNQAEKWLDANTHNRSVVNSVVTAYARDMANGRWALNGEAVKIAVDGTILDGQHRLLAVVQADVKVPMLIVTGLEPETQKTMDSGRKRTFSDNLRIDGTVNAAVVASICLRGWMWDSGDRRFKATVRPTQSEMRAWREDNPSVHRSAEIASRTRTAFKAIPQSSAGTAHLLFNRVDQNATAEFFARLASGAGLDEGDPILTLRNRLIRDVMEKKSHPDVVRIGLFIKAWNAYRNGETVGGLLMTPDTKMPEPI